MNARAIVAVDVTLFVRTSCRRCNGAVPLDRPRQSATCGECGTGAELDDALWHEVLSSPHTSFAEHDGEGGWALIDGRLHGSWRAGLNAPECPACGAAMAEEWMAAGPSRRQACGSCGEAIESAPPPSWLQRIYPAAQRLLVSTDAADREQAPVPIDCVGCGASFELDARSPRTVACAHCSSRLYIPQRLWRTLHPPVSRRAWVVRLRGGPSPPPPRDERQGPPVPPATRRDDLLWLALELRTTCPHCNRTVALDGPRRHVRCPSCDADLPLEALVRTALSGPHRDGLDGNQDHGGWALMDGSLRGSWNACAPHCVRCGTPISEQAVTPGADQRWSCPGCAEPFETFPAPRWLRSVYPPAAQVVALSRDALRDPAAGDVALRDEGAPVSVGCTGCGAPLQVDSSSSRIVPCDYCGGRFYLPDPLWSALHPHTAMRRWLVALHGGVPATLDPPEVSKALPPETGATADAVYVSFSIRTGCPACNGGVPLLGPSRLSRCLQCYAEVPLTDALWTRIFRDPASGWQEALDEWDGRGGWISLGGGGLQGEWQVGAPSCPACSEPLVAQALAPGIDGRSHCTACGFAIDAFPAPTWLRSLCPAVQQLYMAERERAPDGGAAAAKAILLECPSCGASLAIDPASPRSVHCDFCEHDVYLPDSLWLTLHPRREIQRWFARIGRI